MGDGAVKMLKDSDFSLVLSGGGALGIAHVGVLQDMQKLNLLPSEIVGTSMGGIIGASLSIGMKHNEIYALFEEFSNVLNWVRFSFEGDSIIKSSKIEKIFKQIFQNRKMRDTEIPLKLIATEFKSAKQRVFCKDDDVEIKDALLATMAIPGIFEAKEIDGIVYVDGFLCENLGVNQATCRAILAVDVLGENSFEKELPKRFFKTQNVMEMLEKSLRMLILNQTKANLKHLKKELILLEPNTKDYKTFQFHKYKEIKELGIGLLKDRYLS